MSKVVKPESPHISGMAQAIAGYRAEFAVEFWMALHRHR